LRPIRLAFLVEPGDSKTLQRVFEINTCLWGGRFNGVIPVFQRTPRWWDRLPGARASAREIVSGYLAAFEPDFVVATRPGLETTVSVEEGRVIQMDDVLSVSDGGDEHVGYGLNVVGVYRRLYEDRFQFVERHPQKIVVPKAEDGRLDTFVAASLGVFPHPAKLQYFERAYRDAFEASDFSVDGASLWQAMGGAVRTPLRVGSAGLDVKWRGWSLGPYLFFMDGTSPDDLVDYWNLRAIGWRVVPIPKQWAENLIGPCTEFVKTNHVPYRDNPTLMHETTLLVSRRVKSDDAKSFAGRIRGGAAGGLVTQEWYPRLWDEWARGRDHAQRCEVVAREDEIEGSIEDDRVTFSLLAPEGTERLEWSDRPKWANVLRLREPFGPGTAGVVPPGLPKLRRMLDAIGDETIAATSEGIVVTSRHAGWSQQWRLPEGFQVFQAWLASRDLRAQLSGAGRVAGELIRMLGGPVGISAIANIEIIKLLHQMAHGLVELPVEEGEASAKPKTRGRMVPRKQWWDLLQKVNDGIPERAERHLQNLVDRGVLRIGLRLQCSVCSQANWYALGDVAEQLRCERCLRSFPFPSVQPPGQAWHYRTQGPFSVENYAQGAYTVALALRFLTTTLHAETTWVPGLEIYGHDGVSELDFGMWWREWGLRPSSPRLIFGEGKTFGRFERRDIARARKLAAQFPGAVIVFATLRDELDHDEKKRIAGLARSGRKSFREGESRAPVLVLTSHELLRDMRPPYCWQDSGGRFADFAREFRAYRGLLQLCDATQQLHLDMEPYDVWQMQYWEDRRRRRAGKAPEQLVAETKKC
jgi:hypothetical protein